MSLLVVSGLTVGVRGRPEPLLRDVGFSIEPGQVVGLVGESGSGKSLISLAMMGLLPRGVELRSGRVQVGGSEQLTRVDKSQNDATAMTMIFQNPIGALNPTMRVGAQIARVLRRIGGLSKSSAREESVEMMRRVGISGAEHVARVYPHQLSGGMSQRVMIAMALACRPSILSADEPTTALDVTVQAEIFDLLRELVAETNCGVLFITHDLGVVAELCDRVVVLYGGQVMEVASTIDIYESAQHPYTRFLFESLEGEVDPRIADPGPDHLLTGCRFAHRCPHAWAACSEVPPLVDVAPDGHRSACFLKVGDSVGSA
jgi:oligopeptide/dipeptide ABC transporter ATP-binding protein